jgi:hypothetical protein
MTLTGPTNRPGVLRSRDTHKEWNLTSHPGTAQWTWWPELYVDLEMVLGTFYNLPQNQQGHYMRKRALGDTSSLLDRQALRSNGFFACPGYESGAWHRDCGGIESFYCAHWKCVVTNDGEWKWAVTPDLITMQFVKPYNRWQVEQGSNLVKISFTEKGKKERRWVSRLTWGLLPYKRPWRGVLFQILLRLEPISNPIGPNPVLKPNPKSKPELSETKLVPRTTQNPQTFQSIAPSNSQSSKMTLPGPTTTIPFTPPPNPLETLLLATFKTLNRTAPNLTEACWLCYSPSPPFYEAIGVNSSFTVKATVPTTNWEARPAGLTMAQVSGRGTCVGKVPRRDKRL